MKVLRVTIFSRMKIIQKKKTIFGNLILAAPKNRGVGRDKLVINTRPVVFQEHPQISISITEGRLI
jgi:hypothetical protein